LIVYQAVQRIVCRETPNHFNPEHQAGFHQLFELSMFDDSSSFFITWVLNADSKQ
jgi:hypothetical protein